MRVSPHRHHVCRDVSTYVTPTPVLPSIGASISSGSEGGFFHACSSTTAQALARERHSVAPTGRTPRARKPLRERLALAASRESYAQRSRPSPGREDGLRQWEVPCRNLAAARTSSAIAVALIAFVLATSAFAASQRTFVASFGVNVGNLRLACVPAAVSNFAISQTNPGARLVHPRHRRLRRDDDQPSATSRSSGPLRGLRRHQRAGRRRVATTRHRDQRGRHRRGHAARCSTSQACRRCRPVPPLPALRHCDIQNAGRGPHREVVRSRNSHAGRLARASIRTSRRSRIAASSVNDSFLRECCNGDRRSTAPGRDDTHAASASSSTTPRSSTCPTGGMPARPQSSPRTTLGRRQRSRDSVARVGWRRGRRPPMRTPRDQRARSVHVIGVVSCTLLSATPAHRDGCARPRRPAFTSTCSSSSSLDNSNAAFCTATARRSSRRRGSRYADIDQARRLRRWRRRT